MSTHENDGRAFCGRYTEDEFRPKDLPLGWDVSPASDPRNWLTKTTATAYYDLSKKKLPLLPQSVFDREERHGLCRLKVKL